MSHILEQGGDVTVEGYDHIDVADRIEFLDCGMVKLVWKHSYEKGYFPREKVTVHTHTRQEEEEDWW